MVFLEQNESIIRLSVFLGVFVLMAVLETMQPKKIRVLPQPQRWFTNISLVAIDTLTLRLAFPLLAVGAAELATAQGWGVLSLVPLPFWLEVALSVALLDMLIYAQHVAFHKAPILWRLHRVHHADRDMDVTTGIRFHPIEISLSMLYKLVCVLALGAPAISVFILEVLLNASALFNHANFRLPDRIDRLIRLFIVTPDMHRVHHSIDPEETDSNYGFFLSIWDRLFRTYIPQPKKGHDAMIIGIANYQDDKPSSLSWSILLPFVETRSKP